ncbi:MAG: hypothetical protein HQL24_08875 [Candidatus Omnitrophica bacterium]|nr:hypothetical protein [Candidatus Omnitrophota bacterium]
MNTSKTNPFVGQIIDIAKAHGESANQHIIEGNKFEFDVCDLLMKGAGGAIFFYIALLNIPKTTIQLNLEVFLFLGFSLLLGILHKLSWSRVALRRARSENKVRAHIMKNLYDKVFTQENNDIEILKLWKSIADEETRFYDGCLKGEKIKQESFFYMVPPQHFFPHLIFIQIIFIILAGFAILNKFSVVALIKAVLPGA